MDRNDRQAIEDLFAKLADVERNATARDAEAEAYIDQRLARQPGAAYYMAQTIVVQEQALRNAQMRIEELERGGSEQPRGGGLLDSLFGSPPRSRPAASVPRVGRSGAAPQRSSPFDQPQRGSGGGFLAGAAQTAMGVAGGVLLGSAIGGMFGGGGDAHAADGADQAADDVAADDVSSDDGGFGDSGDFGDMDI